MVKSRRLTPSATPSAVNPSRTADSLPPPRLTPRREPDHSGTGVADAAVAHHDLAIGIGGDARLVRDQHDGRSLVAGSVDEQVHHELARQRVEGAGGLVGEHHAGVGDHRSCQRDPLRLTARQLPGATSRELRQPDLVEPRARSVQRLAPTHSGEEQRQRDVLDRAELGHELTELEDEAELLAPELGTRPFGEGVDARPVEPHFALVGAQDARETVQQRRLAGAARPHDRQDFTRGNVEVHAAQRFGRAKRASDIFRAEHRCISCGHG